MPMNNRATILDEKLVRSTRLGAMVFVTGNALAMSPQQPRFIAWFRSCRIRLVKQVTIQIGFCDFLKQRSVRFRRLQGPLGDRHHDEPLMVVRWIALFSRLIELTRGATVEHTQRMAITISRVVPSHPIG